MERKTKIVATLGPASHGDKAVKKLVKAGVNVFRFNTKHNTLEWHKQKIRLVKKATAKRSNLIGIMLDIPGASPQSSKILKQLSLESIDFIALSFVRNPKDIFWLKKQLLKLKSNAQVVAKIESSEAIEKIGEIADASDAVMVARGDLGEELPIEELAFWQKTIVDLCRQKNTPVIIATQMLESMVDNPSPTRAEATDIANAVMGGTDAMMLSEETAIGKYPVECVEVMSKIARFYEKRFQAPVIQKRIDDNRNLFAKLALALSQEEDVLSGRFLVYTQSGLTAKALSSLRPAKYILAITQDKEVAESLSLSYGVCGIAVKRQDVMPELISRGICKKGERFIVLRGTNWGERGSTNTLTIVEA